MRTTEGGVPRSAYLIAWTGTLLFFGSLSFFLFSYVVTFGESGDLPAKAGSYAGSYAGSPAISGRDGRAIAIDVALFTIFALHHSLFARERVREWVARIVPPYLERAFYVWVASLLFVAVCWSWRPVSGVAWEATGAWRWAALGVQAAGIWIILHSAAMIDILELSGIRHLAPRNGPMEFKTTGPYGWVRHPIYSGWFLFVFGVPTMTMTRLVFAVVSSVYLLVAIPFEERSLRRAAGESYKRYIDRVRWKLIPRVY